MKTFSEQQKFTQWWIWLILIGVAVNPIYGLYMQIYLGEQFGDKLMSNFGLFFYLILSFLVLILFLVMKLNTTINSDGIQMSFFPFKTKKVNWAEIKNVEVINYGFVGGWGIRLWTKYGTVYNIRGNKGVFIELKNGTKFLIGTQRGEEMKMAINDNFKIKETLTE